MRPGAEVRGGFVLCGLVALHVYLVPDAPHLDGIRWAPSIEAGHVESNPNYLLMQPIAVAAYQLWETLGLPADALFVQKLLNVLAAALSLLAFHLCSRTLEIREPIRLAGLGCFHGPDGGPQCGHPLPQ